MGEYCAIRRRHRSRSSRLAGIPATIVTSTRTWPGEQGAAAFAIWLEQQQAFARVFTSHRFVRVEGSGRYVQRRQPELVVREIEALAGKVR
jgi:hypothetical protein